MSHIFVLALKAWKMRDYIFSLVFNISFRGYVIFYYIFICLYVGLFMCQIYTFLQILIPLEEEMGRLFTQEDSPEKYLAQSTASQSLFIYHIVVLGILFLSGVQQTVSYNHQKPRNSKASGGKKGSKKNGKASKNKKRNWAEYGCALWKGAIWLWAYQSVSHRSALVSLP